MRSSTTGSTTKKPPFTCVTPDGCFSSISVTHSFSSATVPNRADGRTTVMVARAPQRR